MGTDQPSFGHFFFGFGLCYAWSFLKSHVKRLQFLETAKYAGYAESGITAGFFFAYSACSAVCPNCSGSARSFGLRVSDLDCLSHGMNLFPPPRSGFSFLLDNLATQEGLCA